MKKLRQKIGFTMAELLIVVAIIAVLVAIAIPILNTQLEKAREAHDIATMRSAASLAVEYYYAGVKDEDSAIAAGLKWWPNHGNDANAAGVYDPSTGKFLPKRSTDMKKAYGKGTKNDSQKTYTYNSDRQIYAPSENYSNAVCMIALYPNGDNKHIDVYWKDISNGNYIGGPKNSNDPKYSIRINID